MDNARLATFRKLVWGYYDRHGRHDLPWRVPEADGAFDPYKILVSELMLQQTQVPRVIPKYHEFLAKFPDVKTLAQASLGEVLVAWSGLGYNRRAKFLWQAAQKIVNEMDGEFPTTLEGLVTLPGVGKNTAGAILAYAFNQPVVFIETNIRSVYIHHFFNDQTDIPDAKILELVEATIPREGKEQSDKKSRLFAGASRKTVGLSRSWYWSLMDYGTYLKQTEGNTARASKAYKKQSKFHGSKRQIRGLIIRELGQGPKNELDLLELAADERTPDILEELVLEQMIRRDGDQYKLA